MNSFQLEAAIFGGTIVYTASAPANVLLRKSASSTEPMAALAPRATSPEILAAFLLITVTSCSCDINFSASGFAICPADPVITYFMIFGFYFYLYIQLIE